MCGHGARHVVVDVAPVVLKFLRSKGTSFSTAFTPRKIPKTTSSTKDQCGLIKALLCLMLTWLRMGHPLDYLISPNQTGTVCSFLGFSPPWVYVDTKPVGTVPQGNGSYLQPFHSLEDAEEALRLLDPEELRPSLYH